MRRGSLAFGLAIGFCVTACAYAIIGIVQASFFPSPDPRTLLSVTKIAFYFRAEIAGYAGVLAALGAYAIHPRAPAALERALPRVGMITAALVVFQGLFVP